MLSLLFDLGNQGIADHDLRHPPRKFKDVIPHPVRGLFVRGKRLIRAVKPADSDQHVLAAIEQIIAPESRHLSQQRHKTLPHSSSEFLRRAVSHIILSDAGEHVLPLTVSLNEFLANSLPSCRAHL